jgi:hypothetical protein
MKITFGLALDGFRSSQPVFNHLFCGPLGLVDTLENRLGIAHQRIGAATRLHRYLEAMEAVVSTRQCFFSASLQADRWGTAVTLLDMRDELRMAGWNGQDTPLPRLRDFAEVESRLGKNWAPGLAERIAGVLAALENHHSDISELECVDRRKFLHHQLSHLLEVLGAKFVDVSPKGNAPEGTNLRLVQDALSGKDIGKAKWREEDDSVLFLTAFSEVTLAHAAARLLPTLKRSAFLATCPAQAVADVIRGYQQPAPALDTPSPLRPIVQVLGLALEMRWSPPDPAILLQFLTHPVSPIERGLRSALADAVADQPGIGSKAWTKAIENYRERIEKSETITSEEKAAKLLRIEKDLEQWLLVQRFSKMKGASGVALAETASQVQSWAGMRASMTAGQPEARHFACLAAHAAEFAAIAQEIPRIQAEELSHILEQVCASAPSAGDQLSELGSCNGFADSAAVIEPCDAILWWGFENQESRFLRRWSERNSEQLRGAGIFLPTAETHLAKFHEMTARPFFAARKQIVLLWPKSRGGDPVERHPLCTLLTARFGHLPILDLDQDELPLAKTVRSVVPLPPKQRWVKLPNPALLQLRKEESYSSLSKFVLRPFEWVFNYPAKLRRGTLREINPFIQRGNLVHHVVEHLLEPGCSLDWKNANEAEFDPWLRMIWSQLLETEGANLLQPGLQTDGQRLLEDARRSVWRLISHMRNAGVASAKADEKLGPIPMDSPADPQISGYIDLLVTDSKGHSAVVDLKFGQGKAKRKELATNTALQLAIYAKLVQATSGQWPEMAYFILRSGNLLAQTDTFFSDAEKIASSNASAGPEAIWNLFLEVWRWRMGQLQSGWIEFPIEGTTPSDGSSGPPSSDPPRAEWTSDPKARRYDDFQFLTGWEAAK